MKCSECHWTNSELSAGTKRNCECLNLARNSAPPVAIKSVAVEHSHRFAGSELLQFVEHCGSVVAPAAGTIAGIGHWIVVLHGIAAVYCCSSMVLDLCNVDDAAAVMLSTMTMTMTYRRGVTESEWVSVESVRANGI